MNKEAKRYYHNCKKVFPFCGKKEKKYLEMFKERIEEFSSENGNVTYEDYVFYLGEPKEMMISYIQDCDNEYLLHKINIKNLMKRLSIVMCTILIVTLATITVLTIESIEVIRSQRIIYEETVIEQDGKIYKQDGTIIEEDGTIIVPNGTIIKRDGTIIPAEGTTIEYQE